MKWLTAAAFGLGLGWSLFLWTTHPSPWADGEAYWLAAERLRSGEPLYLPGHPADPTVYRYAPWFAWAWVPLTYLPKPLVTAAWIGLLLACSVAVCWRVRGWTSALSFPLLVVTSLFGNVQPLLLFGLIFGSGMLGIVASLKPAALGVALLRGEWMRLAIGVAVAAVLWAPALLYDLSGYPSVRGLSPYDVTWLLALLRADPHHAKLGRPVGVDGHVASRGPRVELEHQQFDVIRGGQRVDSGDR